MKRFLLALVGAVCVLAIVAVIYLLSASQSEPVVTRVTEPNVADTQPNASKPSEIAAESQAPEADQSSSTTPPSNAHVGLSATMPKQELKTATGRRSSLLISNDHQRVSSSIMDAYLSDMYTDEKAKAPFPEMAAVMHLQRAQEPVDPNWGPPIEQLLQSYFAAGLGEHSEIDLVATGCNSATCEVIGVIQNPNSRDINGPMARWELLVQQMPNQPWWSQYALGQTQAEIAMGAQNSTLLFLYLLRQGRQGR